jgi:hypothetical protein
MALVDCGDLVKAFHFANGFEHREASGTLGLVPSK